MDVSAQSSITDYLVIATATSEPQLRALRVELEKALDSGEIQLVGMETAQESGWIVIDAFDVMIHLFLPVKREHYDLERLWHDAVELPLAKMVAESLPANAINAPGLAICVSCVGRKLVMAEQIADEIRIVKDTLGGQAAITGFYSNGEFCPTSSADQSVLHNQTMTIGYLTEDMAA